MKKRSVFILLILFMASGFLPADEKKTAQPFEKTYEPMLIFDSTMGDKDERYLLNLPTRVATDSKGNIYIVDRKENRISKYNRNGKFITAWGGKGAGPGEFYFLGNSERICIDNNDRIYIADTFKGQIQIFDSGGNYLSAFTPPIRRGWDYMAVDSKGNIFITTDFPWPQTKTIHKFLPYQKGYKLTASFSDNPFLSPEIVQKKKSFETVSRSLIVHNEKDELFQLFTCTPLIRKFSPDGKLLWEKTIDLGLLPKFSNLKAITHIKKYGNIHEATAESIDEYYIYTIFSEMLNDFVQSRILIKTSLNYAILEMDYEGNLTGAYYRPPSLKIGFTLGFDKADGLIILLDVLNTSLFRAILE